jgi:Flp pilus assembly protein TadB
MLENPRARRRAFFASALFTVLTLLFLIVRTVRKPDAHIPVAAMVIAVACLVVMMVWEIRTARRKR